MNSHLLQTVQIVTLAVFICTLPTRDQLYLEKDLLGWDVLRLFTDSHPLRINRTHTKNCIVAHRLVYFQINHQRRKRRSVPQKNVNKTTVIVQYKGAFLLRCHTLILEFHVTFQTQRPAAPALLMCTSICPPFVQISYIVMSIHTLERVIHLQTQIRIS